MALLERPDITKSTIRSNLADSRNLSSSVTDNYWIPVEQEIDRRNSLTRRETGTVKVPNL